MLCDECDGSGCIVSDDGGDAETCWWCEGTGRVPWWEYFMVWVGVQCDRVRDWLRFTRLGNRYWRWRGRERNARRLAKAMSRFEIVVRHGHSLNRLRTFADALESGTNVDQWYRAETRIAAECARAIEIVDGKNP